jgi:hypothetical protein
LIAETVVAEKFHRLKVCKAMGVIHQTVRKYIEVGCLRVQRVEKPLLIAKKSIRAFLDA